MAAPNKGLTMIRAGSIVGISINYDVTATSGNTLDLEVYIDAAKVWSNVLDKVAGTDKTAQFTQARGTDTFAAGDVIRVRLSTTGLFIDTINVDEVIVMLEFYYDD